MPPTLTYPGVYIAEVPGGVHPIEGVPTSVTAFIGRAEQGPVDKPVLIHNLADYDQQFGGLWADSTMSHSVRHFFRNGGTDAIIVRVQNGGVAATFTFHGEAGALILEAANPGSWADNLEIEIDHQDGSPGDDASFNLAISEVVDGETVMEEDFHELSTRPGDDRCIERVLEQQSDLLRVQGEMPTGRPNPGPPTARTNGSDGADIGFSQIADPSLKPIGRGIWALDNAGIFNLLCIPPFSAEMDVDAETWTAAQHYCHEKRAMLIIDAPSTWSSPSDVVAGEELTGAVPVRHKNAAVYFPRVKMANPLKDDQVETFAPCGLIAGTYARTDSQRGVWKAPAGLQAQLVGVDELACTVTDPENDKLNGLGVNCLRSFPDAGDVIWGSRTTVGAHHLASEWQYVPVRRLALYIEESLYRGMKRVVFEPNDETLWANIRITIAAFMQNLFRAGAFPGSTPDEAYFVKCDRETMTQTDIDLGVVNIHVGFAPVRPAEFVVIRIRQMAGQIQD
ncbi:MAG: phage tail sheath subtilisin-like domain-containing protein [Gammaproteobacteria bacterium]|nr:phage tail sheath subtilisin-like domain-containing protein [Gammaproteobacteria bacterium]MDH3431025.1 phage tail sheath subtilisin-like domain-containing protein [Gammaproteobacteria bacterium]MDH3433464.1 phage tail sheath subtilisin-like domain-containing protein [Gammaproteobacteria bacterium]